MGKGSGEVRLKGEKSKDSAMKMEKLNRFENKVVVITGASRGIGRAIALRFASEGAALVVSANEDRVNDVAEEIRALGTAALPVTCDVSQKPAVELLYDKAVEEFGRVDISVQNAGIITIATVEEMTEDEWDRFLVRESQIENRQKRWPFYCNIFVTNTISLKIRIASGAGEVCSNTENEEKCLTKMAKCFMVTGKCNEKSRSVRRIVPSWISCLHWGWRHK
jgi:hypothetical protein